MFDLAKGAVKKRI